MKTLRKFGLVVPVLLAAAGCQELNGKATGGGTLDSVGGSGKAVFAFTASNCEDKNGDEVIKGKMNYRDRTAIDYADMGGVGLQAEVTDAALCGDGIAGFDPNNPTAIDACACDPGEYNMVGDYRSTNPKLPGEGVVNACVLDMGTGTDMHGIVELTVASGPYEGYANLGSLQGNVKAHECPGTKNK